jgi:hypothetical protein
VVQNESEDAFCTLSYAQFQRYCVLVRRLGELNDTLICSTCRKTPNNEASVLPFNKHDNEAEIECMICCDTIPKQHQTILHCGPTLCETCEQRCFKRKLACPYCRQSFRNRSDAQNSGWHMTADDVSTDIQQDVQLLEQHVQEFWEEVIRNEPLQLLLSETRYVPIQRHVYVQPSHGNKEEEEEYTVVHVQ